MSDFQFDASIKMATQTLAAIDAALVDASEDGLRQHMGASVIGGKCSREIWLKFRWARASQFEGRMLRLFARGQREEAVIARMMQDAGIKVYTVDQATGKQFEVRAVRGHFGGSMDGKLTDVPEAPKTQHVWECKTHSKKSFDDLTAKGVQKSKPQHYDQMQIYMHLTGITRALYTGACKDDDRLHIERVDYDKERAEELMQLAQYLVDLPEPPARIGGPDWYQCKFCDYYQQCHGSEAPLVNCRTCAHCTPVDNAQWKCERHNGEVPVEFMRQGCADHRYIPSMLDGWAKVSKGDDKANTVEYLIPGVPGTFTNGSPGYTSHEILAAQEKRALPLMNDNAFVQQMREQYGAKVVA